jgi:hypothetical protein
MTIFYPGRILLWDKFSSKMIEVEERVKWESAKWEGVNEIEKGEMTKG